MLSKEARFCLALSQAETVEELDNVFQAWMDSNPSKPLYTQAEVDLQIWACQAFQMKKDLLKLQSK